jgi:hypothetical protein
MPCGHGVAVIGSHPARAVCCKAAGLGHWQAAAVLHGWVQHGGSTAAHQDGLLLPGCQHGGQHLLQLGHLQNMQSGETSDSRICAVRAAWCHLGITCVAKSGVAASAPARGPAAPVGVDVAEDGDSKRPRLELPANASLAGLRFSALLPLRRGKVMTSSLIHACC